MLCSVGLQRILYALSVTCRSVLIIERSKVRAERKVSMCVCVRARKQERNCRVKLQQCLHSVLSTDDDDRINKENTSLMCSEGHRSMDPTASQHFAKYFTQHHTSFQQENKKGIMNVSYNGWTMFSKAYS